MTIWKSIGLVLALSILILPADSGHSGFNGSRYPYLLPLDSFIIPSDVQSFAPAAESASFVPDQILVKFRPFLSAALRRVTLNAYRSKPITVISKLDIYQIKIPEFSSVEEMVYLMSMNPFIAYAEPNYIARIAVTPNDPYFNVQYGLSNTGQRIGNVPGSPQGKESADIHATSAWEEVTGREDVIIGIVDTGIDFDHPELRNKFVSRGKDFVNNDDDATDDNGHGTHVASIAAADTDNGIGMAGVAWKCKILPAKAIAKNGVGFYSWIIQAVEWLADNGAHVINFSIGGDASSLALEDAVKYAFNKGVFLAAAAGNDSPSVLYPAAYEEYCLAVAATDYNDERPGWSNTGEEIDVAAPGERIFGCVPTWYWSVLYGDFDADPYGYGYGTSAAVPYVTGLAALIRSLKPNLKPKDIMNIIRYSADDINHNLYPGKDQFIGYGRINAEKALRPIIIIKDRK